MRCISSCPTSTSCSIVQAVLRTAPRPFQSARAAAALKGSGHRRSVTVCAKRSGGVLDSPTISTTPTKETDRVTKRPPTYKVLLHNDNYNRREYVVKVLLKVIEGMSVDDAVVVMQEAHEQGLALVLACPQEEAERYVESLRLNGLTASMEPGC